MATIKATRYCRYENTFCEFATEHGYCQQTACTKQKPQETLSTTININCEELAEITYETCADALLKLWMDKIITDSEYNRIMDRLNNWGKSHVQLN